MGEHWPAAASAHYVVSDLHLNDGDPATETWRAPQQAAWERLLARIPAASAGAATVELIVNGDCFDFLMAAPYLTTEDETTAADGVAKLRRIVTAHADWLGALAAFLREPGRSVTFLIGNHDLELAFATVRERVRAAIGAPAGAVRFCARRAYRPLADVLIEHGCQFDPWNVITGLWDDGAAAATPDELETAPGAARDPSALRLPFGSRYYGRVFRAIQRRFPYFDAFAPGLPQPGILALVCLVAPELLVASAPAARTLYEGPPADGPDLATAAADGPAALYDALLPGMAALQAQVWRATGAPVDAAAVERALGYIGTIQAALAGSQQLQRDAVRAIFRVPEPRDAENAAVDAAAARDMAARAPATRLALCGHTHGERIIPPSGPDGGVTYLNTGTWYPRLALPGPEAVDDALLAWLRAPSAAPPAARDAAAFTFAELQAAPGAPTSARLCQVGADGW